ncbi:hypothetical protein HPP92_006937 [Vanilla planifolia]|uniref:Uncharacterized protein n=1 Tax=Vanilla planifolia TaxID=51239 RepID=A0A835V9K9_VANPL|nr:hypothetical protein HPP92_006937 [Vanilla planifolia]
MVSMKTEDGAAPNMVARLKREECSRTKHDKFFSKWEILIGPNDWEDHDSGKDGVERYRIHNLPSGSSCPGLYELGVTHTPTIGNHRLRKLDPEDVVVVYLGQADNVRTRLQEYGRSGSHLNDRNRIALTINYESSSQRERTALFRDVFSKGYSIVFRWTPVKSKNDAEKTEIDLLNVFDYAWNRRGNGSCRHADILAKLKQKSSTAGHSPLRRLQRMNLSFGKKMGINIDESLPFLEEVSPPHGLKAFLLPRVLKFSGSQLQFLRDTDKSFVEVTCGVAIGHGAVCRRKPLPGERGVPSTRERKLLEPVRLQAGCSPLLLEFFWKMDLPSTKESQTLNLC